ncbi:LysR family transcriptional regulator [Kibdelosporangium phytohabitans]|uniref:LysR family transcriptional regulator n=1 Tax=Kibdelosporangium phytohabitans TaxID=860235 RepID=UPI00146FE061|nr:LysR family transcriptional regulator [Kibdelosporangium phytohabitans]MBE1470158.1 DNA-binding transcriptional LysR family regulator [Kibdelosporangium phytohabitans]
MIDPRLLVTLEAVVRLGSFAAAAAELGYTQSAVSQQIADLERRAGLRVLDRRPVRPTAAGMVLLRVAGEVRAAMSRATTELTALDAGRAGEVRLSAFVSAANTIVPAALAKLRETHPGVVVSLTQLETTDSYDALLRGDVDLAVTFDYDRFPQPEPSGVRRTPLGRDPVVVALPATHPLADRESVSLADLADESWIGTPVTGTHLDLLAELARSPGFKPRLAFDGDDFRTVLGLVAHGLGIAPLPTLALADTVSRVVAVPITEEPLVRFLYTCRLDTTRTPGIVTCLGECLAAATKDAMAY